MMWERIRRIAGTIQQRVETMTQHADLLARYKKLRQAGLELNNRLVKTLTRSVIDEGGKKLGILKRNVLTLDTRDEIGLLMDYCIHDVRRRGLNAVDQNLAASPPQPASDELILLQALQQARFSLFVVEAVERGVGTHVRDLLLDEPLFLVDVGLSRTAPVGMVLAARVMAPEGISMTTGAALPVRIFSSSEQAQLRQGLKTLFPEADFRHLSAEEASELAATVIRKCLEQGAAERIRYTELGLGSGPRRLSKALPPDRRIGRNKLCPCGSGRKFKHCCTAKGR